jgi:hypothetical protein
VVQAECCLLFVLKAAEDARAQISRSRCNAAAAALVATRVSSSGVLLVIFSSGCKAADDARAQQQQGINSSSGFVGVRSARCVLRVVLCEVSLLACDGKHTHLSTVNDCSFGCKVMQQLPLSLKPAGNLFVYGYKVAHIQPPIIMCRCTASESMASMYSCSCEVLCPYSPFPVMTFQKLLLMVLLCHSASFPAG